MYYVLNAIRYNIYVLSSICINIRIHMILFSLYIILEKFDKTSYKTKYITQIGILTISSNNQQHNNLTI